MDVSDEVPQALEISAGTDPWIRNTCLIDICCPTPATNQKPEQVIKASSHQRMPKQQG